MPRLHVCSLARLHETASATRAGSLMSLLSPGGVCAIRPPGIAAEYHLVVNVSDLAAPVAGHAHAEATHVGALRAFSASGTGDVRC